MLNLTKLDRLIRSHNNLYYIEKLVHNVKTYYTCATGDVRTHCYEIHIQAEFHSTLATLLKSFYLCCFKR